MIHEKKTVEIGDFLVAQPLLNDSNFNRTVVLVAEHSTEDGTIGFVLNRAMELRLHEVIGGVEPCDHLVYYGGPVQQDNLFFIHSLGALIPDSTPINEKLFWGGDFEVLRKMIAEGEIGTHQVRFLLGYSGWGENQLAAELEEKSWIVVPENTINPLTENSEMMWKNVLLRMENDKRIWANMPQNPILN